MTFSRIFFRKFALGGTWRRIFPPEGIFSPCGAFLFNFFHFLKLIFKKFQSFSSKFQVYSTLKLILGGTVSSESFFFILQVLCASESFVIRFLNSCCWFRRRTRCFHVKNVILSYASKNLCAYKNLERFLNFFQDF